MPTVDFEGNFFGDPCRADADEGGALANLCDTVNAPIPFSCRSATCGTCRVEIIEGGDLFEPREEAESELLEILGDPPHYRLACQAKLKKGGGLVRLRIADEEL